MDWAQWHRAYDDPSSKRAARLAVVRERVSLVLDELAPGPWTAVSMCAGQGRDLLPVLAAHPRGQDARVRLVELDERNVAVARAAAAGAEVVQADAGRTAAYDGMVPADLVLVAGVLETSSRPMYGVRFGPVPVSAGPAAPWCGPGTATTPTWCRQCAAGSRSSASSGSS